jgi:alpha-L-fucosidase
MKLPVHQCACSAVLVISSVLASFLACNSATAQSPSPAVAPAIEKIDAIINQGPFKADWKSLEAYEIPQWYKDAKFGVFIHWGVYSVPAFGSEWYPRMMYIAKERRGESMFDHHVKTYGSQKDFGYKDFIPMFKAENFDPVAWAKLFKEAGFKYVVPVAEHHDGFPMYDCSFTQWDATEMGPKRDIIAELEKSVRAEGMKFGVSSHRAFNWMYYVRSPNFDNSDPRYAGLYGRSMPHLFATDADDYQKKFTPQDDEFKDDWLARTCELVDKYDPDLVWFDFGIAPSQETPYDQNHFATHLQRFAAYYYNFTKARAGDIGVINYKWNAFPESAAVYDKERSKMAEIRQPFWQTDTAVSKSSWGYTEDPQYKSPDRLVDDLVDIVSKNGCLLLNIGPQADGTIPAGDQEVLRAMGGWLKINGESIYGTKFWKIYGEGPTGVSTGHVSESKDQPFTSEDIRFTTKDGVVYATLLDWPQDGIATIKSLATGSAHWPGKINSIEMLGSNEAITWERTDKGLKVTLPQEKPCDFAYVLQLK